MPRRTYENLYCYFSMYNTTRKRLSDIQGDGNLYSNPGTLSAAIDLAVTERKARGDRGAIVHIGTWERDTGEFIRTEDKIELTADDITALIQRSYVDADLILKEKQSNEPRNAILPSGRRL